MVSGGRPAKIGLYYAQAVSRFMEEGLAGPAAAAEPFHWADSALRGQIRFLNDRLRNHQNIFHLREEGIPTYDGGP